MQMCGGRSYTYTTIGYTEYGLAALEYNENLSAHKSRRTLHGSAGKDE